MLWHYDEPLTIHRTPRASKKTKYETSWTIFQHVFVLLLIIQCVCSRGTHKIIRQPSNFGYAPCVLENCSQHMQVLVIPCKKSPRWYYFYILLLFTSCVIMKLWCGKYVNLPMPNTKKNAQHITELIQDIHQDVLSRLPEPWDVAKVQVEMMVDVCLCWVGGVRGFWLLQQQQQQQQQQQKPQSQPQLQQQQPFMSHVLLFTLMANILKPFSRVQDNQANVSITSVVDYHGVAQPLKVRESLRIAWPVHNVQTKFWDQSVPLFLKSSTNRCKCWIMSIIIQ